MPKYSSEASRVTIDVAPVADGCELTLLNHDVPPEWVSETERGWRELLARLDNLLGVRADT